VIHEKIALSRKSAEGYVIPLGIANLVAIVTDVGMSGVGPLMWPEWTSLTTSS